MHSQGLTACLTENADLLVIIAVRMTQVSDYQLDCSLVHVLQRIDCLITNIHERPTLLDVEELTEVWIWSELARQQNADDVEREALITHRPPGEQLMHLVSMICSFQVGA